MAKVIVVNHFCLGRGGKYAVAFLGDWCGTLVRDEFRGYESVVELHKRKAAGCLAYARRKFDELIKDNQSPVALEAVQRIAKIFRIEREVHSLTIEERLAVRHSRSKPLWKEMHVWLQLERMRVPDGSGIAAAIDYSLNHWGGVDQAPEQRQRCCGQQSLREPDAAMGPREKVMAIRRQRTGRPTRWRRDELDSIGKAQWTRPLSVSQGRARAAADATQ